MVSNVVPFMMYMFATESSFMPQLCFMISLWLPQSSGIMANPSSWRILSDIKCCSVFCSDSSASKTVNFFLPDSGCSGSHLPAARTFYLKIFGTKVSQPSVFLSLTDY